MSRRPDETRTRLVDAAERLFAERGIDGVSLREITREAGARNAMALQYHFADRTGIIQAILDKHSPPVEAGRLALLDAYEATDRADLRHLAGALVRPWAAKLGDPAGGREFLRINADIAARPFPADDPPSWTVPTESLLRWRELVEPNLDPTAVLLHRRHTAIAYVAVELGRRARARPHADDRLFTSQLVDVVVAILTAPVSPETARLAAQRAQTPPGDGRPLAPSPRPAPEPDTAAPHAGRRGRRPEPRLPGGTP